MKRNLYIEVKSREHLLSDKKREHLWVNWHRKSFELSLHVL